MPTLTKICGVTLADDAAMVAAAGADFIGINCWNKSRRFVERDRVALIAGAARAARSSIAVVGLFVEPHADEIAKVLAACPLDVIQLHGEETVDDCRFIAATFKLPVWKAIPIGDERDVIIATGWPRDASAAILLDAPSVGRGGSGKRIDPELAAEIAFANPQRKIVLAGGLDASNVAAAIANSSPWCVDVASGVEAAVGIKDENKVRAFIAAARGVA